MQNITKEHFKLYLEQNKIYRDKAISIAKRIVELDPTQILHELDPTQILHEYISEIAFEEKDVIITTEYYSRGETDASSVCFPIYYIYDTKWEEDFLVLLYDKKNKKLLNKQRQEKIDEELKIQKDLKTLKELQAKYPDVK